MPDVDLIINGKAYSVTCDAGQEQRVSELGQYIDSRLKEIAGPTAGGGNDAHLMMLTALVISDELHEVRASVQNGGGTAPVPERVSAEEEQQIVQAIDHMAVRINAVADRLQSLDKKAA